MKKSDEYYMNIAIKEAEKAYRKNEIPVGAVVYSMDEDRIIAKAHNERDSKNIVTNHAEISAIIKANKTVNNWRLINTILYTTLEPCNMCLSVINESKINKVIYGAKSDNTNTDSKCVQIDNQELVDKCSNLLKNKFIEIRKDL